MRFKTTPTRRTHRAARDRHRRRSPMSRSRPGRPGYDDAVRGGRSSAWPILHTGANPPSPVNPDPTTSVSTRYADPDETGGHPRPHRPRTRSASPFRRRRTDSTPVTTAPVPDHPHWVITDLTEPPGAWAPRQGNWPSVLVEQKIPPLGSTHAQAARTSARSRRTRDEVTAVGMLQSVDPRPDRAAFVTTPQPFGLWQQKPGAPSPWSDGPGELVHRCAAGRTGWNVANPSPDAPVLHADAGGRGLQDDLHQLPRAAGRSNGRLAQNLATMTGGNARWRTFATGSSGRSVRRRRTRQRSTDAVYSVATPARRGHAAGRHAVDGRRSRRAIHGLDGPRGNGVHIPRASSCRSSR